MGLFSKIFGGSESKSYADPNQSPFLDFVRNAGQTKLQELQAPIDQFSRRRGRDLFNFGRDSLESLQSNPFLDSLQAQSGGNPELLARQTQQLGADIGQQLNEQILPGIRRDSTAIGALGGSRQGIAEGIAGRGAIDAFSRGATGLATADAQRGLQAGIAGGGLFTQAGLGGVAGANELFSGVGLGQFMGGFAPIGMQADIVGGQVNQTKGSSDDGVLSKIGFSF